MKTSIYERRRSARMMLGHWGCWMQRIEQLEKERRWAQQWLQRCAHDERCGHPAEDDPQAKSASALIREIELEIEQLLALRKFMEEMMNQMPAEQVEVLQLRYLRKLSWQAIAIRMNYDPSSVRRLETRAVDQIAGCMEVQAARF